MRGRKPQLVIDNRAVDRVPNAPGWMSKDAKAEWRRIMPALVDRRVLTQADLGSVENFCVAIATAREAERHLQAHGHVYTTAAGEFKRNPASTTLKDAVQTSRQLAAELGLTPVSRSRPSIRDDDDADSLLD